MLAKFIGNKCEDSLTAAIFTHLLHLPSELFWSILRNSCPPAALPDYPGEPLSVHPWPHWSAEGTINEDHVIPDLVITFKTFDLVIEAKRWDYGMQDESQWKKELVAYTNEFGSNKRQVRMLALGGLHTRDDAELRHLWQSVTLPDAAASEQASHLFLCPVHMCKWGSLLTECQRAKRELEDAAYPSSQARAHRRIFSDLIELFAHHGFQTGVWFADTISHRPHLRTTAADHHSLFQSISSRLRHL